MLRRYITPFLIVVILTMIEMCKHCKTTKGKRMTYWQLADALLKTDFKFVSPFDQYFDLARRMPADKVIELIHAMPPQTWPWTFWAGAIEGVENVDDVFIALFDEGWTYVKNQASAELYAHHSGNECPEN